VRDQHDDGRLAQCQLAVIIEIGVRLVEHDEERVAVEQT
jgi:hypothetical protein